MNWIYLLIASIFEIGWPIGLKMAEIGHSKPLWVLFAIVTMAFSGYFLFLAQKTIPIGIAYAIWTGLGMIGTFIIGITVFHDSISLIKFFGVILILSGVTILKLCH